MQIRFRPFIEYAVIVFICFVLATLLGIVNREDATIYGLRTLLVLCGYQVIAQVYEAMRRHI